MPGPIIKQQPLPEWADPANESVFDPLPHTLLRRAIGAMGFDDPTSMMGVGGPMQVVTGPARRRLSIDAVKRFREFLDKFSSTPIDEEVTKQAADVMALGPRSRLMGRFTDLAPISQEHFASQGAQTLLNSRPGSPLVQELYKQHLARLEKLKAGPPPVKVVTRTMNSGQTRAYRGKLLPEEVLELRKIAVGEMKNRPIHEVVEWITANKNPTGLNNQQIYEVLRGQSYPTTDMSLLRTDAAQTTGRKRSKIADEVLTSAFNTPSSLKKPMSQQEYAKEAAKRLNERFRNTTPGYSWKGSGRKVKLTDPK